MGRLRILVLGPDCDPETVSIRFVTYCHAAALAELHDVTLVARSSVGDVLRRAKASFRGIEVIQTPAWAESLYSWCFRRIFKSQYFTQSLTAFKYPFALAFELRAWRQLRRRIVAGEFDVVLRLLPMTAVIPSPFAFFLRNGPIPFVIGPITGGLPWPEGFGRQNEKEWISGLRRLYRFMPFARSTFNNAAAIIVASSHTYSELDRYRDKLYFIPEPGVGPSVFASDGRQSERGAKLDLIFVGGLIPRKACDIALRAAAPLLRSDRARFTVVGDGPDRERLEALTKSLGIEKMVSFCGWVGHAEVLRRLRLADVMVFPSIRDNGAGVVFEALASGAVPVVADFGGPGDIVHPEIGYKVPLTNEPDMISRIERILSDLAENRELLNRLRQQGIRHARERLTWTAKAHSTSSVLEWALGRGAKPDLPPPKDATLDPRGVTVGARYPLTAGIYPEPNTSRAKERHATQP
jgi:glycosyltransferase involved in cell wall biosynthesis